MIISKYMCLFIAYSFMGWVFETAICTVRSGKWDNRGFLYGPICPIYGTGAVIILIIINITASIGITLQLWQIFIISILGSALLEYVTSFGLEKLFHALWWDYWNWPLNINGRISLFTSLGFGFIGLLIVYYIAPITDNIITFVDPIIIEGLSLIFASLLMMDFTLTVTALHNFDRLVINTGEAFNRNMDKLVSDTFQKTESIKNGLIEKGRDINSRIDLLTKRTRAAVRRIKILRYKGDENVNEILRAIKEKKGEK